MADDRHRVVRFGLPADVRGDVFEPGSVPRAENIPVTVGFDSSVVVGRATLNGDGTADVTMAPGLLIGPDHVVSIGYRVLEAEFYGDVRVIKKAEVLTLGIIPKSKAID